MSALGNVLPLLNNLPRLHLLQSRTPAVLNSALSNFLIPVQLKGASLPYLDQRYLGQVTSEPLFSDSSSNKKNYIYQIFLEVYQPSS